MTTSSNSPAVLIRAADLGYGDGKNVHTVMTDLNLRIESGEFFTLLGPSGCGKSTLLRAVAGFSPALKGSISISGKDVTAVPPERRNVGIVFQSYALFPHLTVQENIRFGLRSKTPRFDRTEINERCESIMARVDISKLAARKPAELSGGQQQRVAIARSLVLEPSLLLLDEPLSNLDVQLRVAMRAELKSLQRNLGITAIYVTHDQEEALALSDRIAVLNDGRIEQIGTPQQIYTMPRTDFVCRFIGESIELTEPLCQAFQIPSSPFRRYIRPHQVSIDAAHTSSEELNCRGLIKSSVFLGDSIDYSIDVRGEEIVIRSVAYGPALSDGTEVRMSFPESCIIEVNHG